MTVTSTTQEEKELEVFKNFTRLFLEQYALEHLGSKYKVEDYVVDIYIKRKDTPKRLNGLPYYDIRIIIDVV